MKRILCYGDSNTWGTIPDGSFCHSDIKDAYPFILQNLLGKEYYVIKEGFPARTTDLDDIKEFRGNRNGSLFFPQCVISHDPLDIIIIYLGTNDLKDKFNRNVSEIANAIETKYIQYVRNNLKDILTTIPQFIIVTPPLISDSMDETFKHASKKSLQFEEVFFQLAKRNDCELVSNKNLECGKDGVHLTKSSHISLAKSLYDIIINM